jgi:hypothetical protein
MSCDIFFFVDVRNTKSGRWESVDLWHLDPGYPGQIMCDQDKRFYWQSNYWLFAILADVRNEDGLIPLAPCRGVPPDASAQYRLKISQHEWAHSPSFCSLAELLAYDWTMKATLSGLVDLEGYIDYKQKGAPKSWSGGHSHALTVSEAEMAAAVEDVVGNELYLIYRQPELRRTISEKLGAGASHFHLVQTSIKWSVPYYSCVRTFLSETVPRLWRLGAPEDVRCLFYFED